MDDLEAFVTIHGDPRTNQHNPAGPVEDAADARQMLAGWIEDWRARGIGYWAIEDPDSGRVVGFAGIRAMPAADTVEVFNLYYRLSPEVWGRGIAGAVAREAIDRAHRDWPGVAVIARMQPGHVVSERTAVSAGLHEVGRDPWGRIVLADRDLSTELLASLPGTEAAARSSAARLELPDHDIVGIRAANPGPFTLSGTNSWLVGRAPAWLVDPGPALDEHLAALEAEIDLRGGLGGVALTHGHADHTEAVPAIRARYPGATLAAARGDADVELTDGDTFGPLHAIATPGHAPEHLAFVTGTAALTGDAVLGEGSVFVSPYPGSLAAYLDGLARLKDRELTVLCPGHGPLVKDPHAKLEQYISHRLDRERRLIAALNAGRRSVDELLDEAWSDAPAQLRPAATVTLAAHLDKLADEGRLPEGVERPTLRF